MTDLTRPMVFCSRWFPNGQLNPDLTVKETGCSAGEKLVISDGAYKGTIVEAITGEYVSHDDAPGHLCIEVRYPDGNYATRADRLKHTDKKD